MGDDARPSRSSSRWCSSPASRSAACTSSRSSTSTGSSRGECSAPTDVPNLELVRKDDVSSFRKIAIGTWRTAYDPSVYGTIELRMDEAVQLHRRVPREDRQEAHRLAHDGQGGGDGAQGVPRRQRHPALEPRLSAQAHRRVLPGRHDRRGRGQGRPLGRDALRRRGASRSSRSTTSSTTRSSKVRARKDPALEKTRTTFLGIPYFALDIGAAADLVSFVHAESRSAALRNPAGSVRQHHDHQHRLARARHRLRAAGALFARADPDRHRRGQGRSRRGTRDRSCRARSCA